jgi:opine dehydrogenase
MNIAVLGGGNGAYAAAADLSEQGHAVRWWRRNASAFAPVLQARALTLTDARGSRRVPIALPTLDAGEAVRGADLVLVPVPAFAQTDIARSIAPHLDRGQVVLLTPGTFGSVAMARTVRVDGGRAPERAAQELPAFGEAGTLPFLCRKHGPLEIAITARAKRLPAGVFPAARGSSAFETMRAVFPAIEPVEDALSAALLNGGPIIHTPLMLMNAGPLEHFERWDIHNEGTQPAVRRVMDALDAERIAIREALGYRAYHFPLRDHYATDRWMYGGVHDKLTASGDWRERIVLTDHRYMREDVACGLGFMVSVADWAGVPVPLARGLLSVAGAVCGRDLERDAARTLAAMDLAHSSAPELRRLLHDGFAGGR